MVSLLTSRQLVLIGFEFDTILYHDPYEIL